MIGMLQRQAEQTDKLAEAAETGSTTSEVCRGLLQLRHAKAKPESAHPQYKSS